MAEKLKVLILNGSPRTEGNTTIAIHEMEHVFEENGVEYETIQVGKMDIRGCAACGTCYKNGKCMFDDIVNELAPKFEAADGMVIASPVFYASANATLIACLDRLFYSTKFDKTMKVGARHICRSGTQPLDDAICTWNIRNLRCPLRYQRSFYDYLLAKKGKCQYMDYSD